jgi:hypothetical protein
MQTRTLIVVLAFGLALSFAPTVSADWQYMGWGVKPEQSVEASRGVAPADSAIRHDPAETEAGPYSIVGGGPITGWQTLPPMTLAGTESPTEWRLVQVRVGMGEGGAPWGGFSLELPMFSIPEV